MKRLIQLAQDAQIWGFSPVQFPLTQQGVDTLAKVISRESSPELVWMDGMASPTHARNQYRRLNTLKGQLERYCAKNGLKTPVIKFG